ncbi:SMI1/KNR4 family protein [Algoriphagus sp. NG3]|uniref:SMI1/KNR4 family protein n=1 Tax=Algoriphagus sp. NG3 TaxID=3097546 RepID=UPI002A7FA1FF|nr:SMI1/KNR4 family protein [Algoriphagus sp. NG3]WPR76543.1 SMI1/KNR4 family protein [Algoriphagus sp. NG3]
MHTTSIPYNNRLKQLQLADIPFNSITIDDVPEPFYKYEGAQWYDHKAFRNILLEKLTLQLHSNVTKLLVFTPKEGHPYVAFAYLSKQEIVAMQLPNSGNFRKWMDNILEKQEDAFSDSFFKSEPDPNERYLIELGKGSFSVKSGIGVLYDDKPGETGAYLHKKAPADYNKVALNNEKDQFIQNYAKANGEMVNTEALIQLIQELIKSKNLIPNPPENNEKVYSEFETLAKYKFPEALKTLLSLHNGIEKTGFLSAQKILAEWKIWKGIYDDPNWKLEDLTGNNQADGYQTLGVYTNPYWVPFYSTGGGNFLAIDYAPGVQGKSGQIISFGADESRIRLIADDMEAFLQLLLSGNLNL